MSKVYSGSINDEDRSEAIAFGTRPQYSVKMGHLFRSEQMALVELFIQSEAAHATVLELGELGMVQFEDLNPESNAFQRTFVKEVRRCDEMERKLRYLSLQVEKAGLQSQADYDTTIARPITVREMDELDEKLGGLETEVKQIVKNEESLRKNFMELTELRNVLEKVQVIFAEASDGPAGVLGALESQPLVVPEEEKREPLLQQQSSQYGAEVTRGSALGYLTGIIPVDKMESFERVLWRTLRGNLLMRSMEIDEPIIDPETDKEVHKKVFVIFSPGEQIQNKIRKICDSFSATLYPSPESADERSNLIAQVRQRMTDLNSVLQRTQDHLRATLGGVSPQITEWLVLITKEKSVFHTMNKFRIDVTSKCFIARGWCPQVSTGDIRIALDRAMDPKQMMVPTIMNIVPTSRTPPTFFRTNKFTNAFQVIIDAYGVGSYQEVNPTPYTLITFPFLFAVMFGDLGHGFIVTFIAFLLCYYEKPLAKIKDNEIFEMLFGGRYIVLLMGIFSIYTGLIYNDIFSKGMEIFESGFDWVQVSPTIAEGEFNNNTYPIGIDIAWHGTDNFLVFTNSYKMKMSVIFGVIQMTFGLVLSLFNHLHFKNMVSVWHEFVPQLIFLQSIFGYLVLCIIYKWCNPWTELAPPSLLTMLIDMFLSPGKISVPLYDGQSTIQVILLILAFIAVPWMLLVKPLYLRSQAAKHEQFHAVNEDEDEEAADGSHAEGGDHGGHGHGGHFDFGEVFIHQVIHTIEFCLGCISNTASYLRLWALSLAHAQLSVVLWDMTIGSFISMDYGVMQILGFFGGFSAWFALTLFILIIMEGLSAFLHALRLHWVEFNNKFYQGNGYKFQPFSFKNVLVSEEEES